MPPFALADEVHDAVRQAVPSAPEKPLFLWVHYMDIHEPLGFFWYRGHGLLKKLKFHLADVLLFLFGDRPRVNRWFKNLYLELYDASIRHVDAHIEKLFAHLERVGVLNHESLIALAADHGEEFFEHGEFGHAQRPYHTNLHVPLLFFSPKLAPARIDRPVSLIDLSPTLAHFAGVSSPRVWRGKNVFDETERPVISQLIDCAGDLTDPKPLGATLIASGHKLINFKGRQTLFSLDDMAERRDLLREKPELVAALSEEIRPFLP